MWGYLLIRAADWISGLLEYYFPSGDNIYPMRRQHRHSMRGESTPYARITRNRSVTI